MNERSTNAARFALTGVAFAAACLGAVPAWALGLGRLTVGSALGETLRAEIEVTSLSSEEASSLRLRVAPPEAYRAAGVDYNSALQSAQVQIVRLPNGRQVVRVSSDRAVLEPFVDVIIEATWSSGRLVREYTLLFDPPTRTALAQQQQPGAQTSPVISSAPAPSTPLPTPAPPTPVAAAPSAALPSPAASAASPAPSTPTPRTAQQRPQPERPPVVGAPAPAPATASGAAADEVRVRAGDSLSRIAGRTQRPGVSLDQMLVALFRGNPAAFSGDNMNRLKSGAVLTVPSTDQAARLPPAEARDVIVAQSADFASYRQRLASGATTAPDEPSARQARGQVQAQVDDRRAAAAPTPDRLRLSQGGMRASAPEAQVSRQSERKDSATRLAELSRNVDELKRLQGAATPAPAPTPVRAPAPAAAPTSPAPAPAAPATAPTPAPAPPAPSPPVPPAPAPAALPAPTIATAPVPAVAPPPAAAFGPASAVLAPTPPARASAPPLAPAPAQQPEPGVLDSILGNSLLLPLGGVLLALLAGLGLYRWRSSRGRHPAGETSFLESRLQPDSFFGASGGQRIDTREASGGGGGNSSMSYSLSQLDAIGDVDPVAEADVYLAYGRDLQAEEILKEAMRSTPERMAIRGKLLEVYAKRRDTRAFELLATQMFNLTRGDGEDWSKAQALGLSIDPENPLYQPGGLPEEVRGAGGQVVAEPLGASTVPYTAPASPPAFQPAADAKLDSDNALDLDLEFDVPDAADTTPAGLAAHAPGQPVPPMEATRPFTTGADIDNGLDFMLDGEEVPRTVAVPRPAPSPAPSPAAAADAGDATLDFDLGSLDDQPRTVALPKATPQAEPTLDFGDFALGGDTVQPPDADADADSGPLSRKLELAEEFRQIGDLEGARDLLEEVLAKGEGPLKAKAQGMLDKL